jgi:peptide/nickel transport system substrate-binding protein
LLENLWLEPRPPAELEVFMPALLGKVRMAALSAVFGTLSTISVHAETVLRVAMTAADIPDWTGQTDQGAEGQRFVGYSIYDSLVNWDLSRSDVEATIAPGLATKWQIDPHNNKRWIFELRQGVKFHDGCAWNADVALWNLTRLIDMKARGFDLTQYTRARYKTSAITSVERIDDYTIAIDTVEADSLFPYNLHSLEMVSQCAVERAGNDWKIYAKAPAGTGPYKFDRVVPHERLELVKNPDYWDKNRVPKHDRLVLIPMPEATTRAAALLSGQVDFIEAPSPDTIDELKRAGMKVITNSYPHNWDYLLNFQRGPFKDLRVRQAANYAVNRDEVVDLLDGTAIPGYGIFTPSSKYYGNPIRYEYDPAKATALLKQANCYPCAVTIAISPSGSGQMQPLPMNELVKSQLDAVGFKVTFAVIDWNTMTTRRKMPWQDSNYDALNNSLNTSDPEGGLLKDVLTRYRVPLGTNWGWYQNAEIDKLGDEAMQTFGEEKQTALLRRIHELAVADAERVFIVDDLNPRALSPKLKGFVQAQSWYQDLTPIVVTDATQ